VTYGGDPIPVEALPKLFQPSFFGASVQASTVWDWAFIVSEIAKADGGTIDVSFHGRGDLFHLLEADR
jgi:hypothetical protein